MKLWGINKGIDNRLPHGIVLRSGGAFKLLLSSDYRRRVVNKDWHAMAGAHGMAISIITLRRR